MKILITGAAGHIGRATVQVAHDAGHHIIATDTLHRAGLPVPLHLADLCDFRAPYALLDGCDAVIHIANHPHRGRVSPDQRLLTENLSMSANVFHAAMELGVHRIVFASSVQVTASNAAYSNDPGGAPEVRLPPYVPLDGNLPRATGTNPYAQSKAFAEELLERFAEDHPTLHAVVLRLPWVMRPNDAQWFERRQGHKRGHSLNGWMLKKLDEGWSYLHMSDAAAALLAGAARGLPGCHTYFPARSFQIEGVALETILDEFAPDLPRKGPIDPETLIDIAVIARDLGWRPKEPAIVHPAPEELAMQGSEQVPL